MSDFAELKARLGLEVPDDLLQLALSHPSAVGEGIERTLKSNQRLEFLGDALVSAMVASYLYQQFPEQPEGVLTARKIAAVRRAALANAAKRLELGKHLIFGRGEAEAGGRERDSNLSDAFEALIGALFISNGWEKTREFVLQVLSPELEIAANALIPAKNRLQELTQAAGLGTPIYRTGATKAGGRTFSAEVLLQDEVRGRGQGSTKKAAEDAAAQMALEKLQKTDSNSG